MAKTADERNWPPPAVPPQGNYVYANSGLWLPISGVDQGDGTAAMLVTGAGITPTATSIKIQDATGVNLAKVGTQGQLAVSIFDGNSAQKAIVDSNGSLKTTTVPQSDVVVTGNITSGSGANSHVDIPTSAMSAGQSACAIDMRAQNANSWTTSVLVIEATINGTDWFILTGYSLTESTTRNSTGWPGPGPYEARVTLADLKQVRVRAQTYAGTDNIAITYQISVATDAVVVKNALPPGANQIGHVLVDGTVTPTDIRTLTERMLAKAPTTGYTLWLDTVDTSYLYIMEAPNGTAAGSTGFRGARVTLDTSGAPLGEVQTNTGNTLTFTSRKTDGNWV